MKYYNIIVNAVLAASVGMWLGLVVLLAIAGEFRTIADMTAYLLAGILIGYLFTTAIQRRDEIHDRIWHYGRLIAIRLRLLQDKD